MVSILVKHSVENYDDWKAGFDEHAGTRMEYGSQGYHLFQAAGDPNEVVVLLEWDSRENAERFLEESDLKDVMEEVGVVGEPEIHFLDEIEAKTPETPAV